MSTLLRICCCVAAAACGQFVQNTSVVGTANYNLPRPFFHGSWIWCMFLLKRQQAWVQAVFVGVHQSSHQHNPDYTTNFKLGHHKCTSEL
jgi:hypothetical protein